MPKVATLTQPHNIGLDPVKYNRGQLIQFQDGQTLSKPRYQRDSGESTTKKLNVCSIDWFEVQLTGQLPKIEEGKTDYEISENLHLIDQHKQTKNFSNLFDVYVYGEKVGTLQTHSKGKGFFDINSMQFKLDNHLLYVENWLSIYGELLTESGWSHKSTTRIDIFLDGSGATNYRDMVYKAVNTRSNVMLSGKAKLSTNYVGNMIQSVNVGSRKSDKYGRIYNKTLELSRSNKTYISQLWDNSHLDVKPGVDIWRLEIEIKSALFKKRNYDLWSLDNPQYLASILRTELDGWLSFYSITTDTNKHRAMKKNTKELVDWESIGADLLPKAKAKKPSDIYQAKAYLKAQKRFSQVFELSTPDEIAEHFELQDWIESKEPYWHADNEKERQRLKHLEPLTETTLN